MISISKKLNKDGEAARRADSNRRISIRDRLLVKEVQEMEQNMPSTCTVCFNDPNVLCEFSLVICPDEGYWKDGRFKFNITIPEEYNMTPPKVNCLTKLWHPNISVNGEVCLSLLRQSSIDGLGWAPTRTLKDVMWGLNSLFTDLLNFEDPLNIEAAEQYAQDKQGFETKVKQYMKDFARR